LAAVECLPHPDDRRLGQQTRIKVQRRRHRVVIVVKVGGLLAEWPIGHSKLDKREERGRDAGHQEQHRGPEPENLEELLHDRDPRRELTGARQYSAALFMAGPSSSARPALRRSPR
jgi:hypothetical protein